MRIFERSDLSSNSKHKHINDISLNDLNDSSFIESIKYEYILFYDDDGQLKTLKNRFGTDCAIKENEQNKTMKLNYRIDANWEYNDGKFVTTLKCPGYSAEDFKVEQDFDEGVLYFNVNNQNFVVLLPEGADFSREAEIKVKNGLVSVTCYTVKRN